MSDQNPLGSQIQDLANLKKVIDYNMDTGQFIWLVNRPSRPKGSVAGSLRKDGYYQIYINNRPILAHRLAWFFVNGRMPIGIDHIDGNRGNNAILNLREADHAENGKNQKRRSTSKSGIMGVYSYKNKFQVQITVSNKVHHLGTIADFFDACCLRKSAEVRYGFHKNHGREV